MRELAIQKFLGVLIVGAAFLFLTPLQIGIATVVFGHGHFLGAYYYQWKAGKMTPTWLILFFGAALILFSLAIYSKSIELFAIGTSILFFVHHFQDEVTLFGKERSLFRSLEQLQPILLYSALAIAAIFVSPIPFALVCIAAVFLVAYIIAIALRAYKPDILSIYFLGIAAVLYALWFFDVALTSRSLLGSVLLFHYVCWYVHFYFRFAQNPERQRSYIYDMIGVHVIVFVAFAMIYAIPGASIPLEYVFGTIFFYVWAILHIVFSVRLQDYRTLLRW